MKKLCIILPIAVSIIYSLYYAGLGGFSSNHGALSKTGLTHPVLFAVWGIITFCVLSGNIIYAVNNKKYYKYFIPMIIISGIGMTFTLCFDFDYGIRLQYYMHCAGSLVFSAVMGITVFLLFLLKKAYILSAASALILITDLILLIIFKETAFIELMPVFAGYIMLAVHNISERKVKVNA